MATYEDIKKANAEIMTTDIKGKQYAEVPQRIKAFRMVYPMGRISTEILSLEDGVCVMQASVYAGADVLLATGTAYEKEGSTFINKTSYIENCETSAVGRALGIAGFGIDASVASAEEVQNAMMNQERMKQEETGKKKIDAIKVSAFYSKCQNDAVPVDLVLNLYKVKKPEDMTEKQFSNMVNNWDKVLEMKGEAK